MPIASPDAWTPASPKSFGGSPAYSNVLRGMLNSPQIGLTGTLDDGETIFNYDAGITAADAIETADSQGQIPGPADLTAADRARRERHDLPVGQRQS